MPKVIGIDLGTTNSVVSVFEGGEPVVIANEQGARVTPSVVGFNPDGSRVLGAIARRQAVQNPQNTIYSIKRFMGRRHKEVESEEKLVPYQITGAPDDLVKVVISDKEFTAPEISAMILRHIKEYSEKYLGEEIKEAVITVPAYFNDSQRQATKDAGHIAGLEVKRIVNEPTAAALAYGLNNKKEGKIAVFDLGGGTFDISILEITVIDGETVFEVLATNGDTHLGGDDFDAVLIDHVASTFAQEHGVDLRQDQMALQRLRDACEKAKCELSSAPSTQINLPFITQDVSKNALHLNVNLTQAKFEQLAAKIFQKIYEPCQNCIKDAGIKVGDLDEIILVGGSTRIPKVQQIAEEIFQKKSSGHLNPDEVVALGAAVQGHILADPGNSSITFLDVTPLSLGIQIEGGIMAFIIERNSTIPTRMNQIFTTTIDNQEQVDIHVYQGERKFCKDNRLLGKFTLEGIEKARKGIPQIDVHFDIDANGILNVTAKDNKTEKKKHITIESSSGLDKETINRMKSEAEQFASEDEIRKQAVEKRNRAEQIVYATEQFLEEHKDLSESDISNINNKVYLVKKAIAETDDQVLDNTLKDLEETLSQLKQQKPVEETVEPNQTETEE